jgi:hypothetical protein
MGQMGPMTERWISLIPGDPLSRLSPIANHRSRLSHASDLREFAQFKGKTVMSPLLVVRSNLDRKIFDNNPLVPR